MNYLPVICQLACFGIFGLAFIVLLVYGIGQAMKPIDLRIEEEKKKQDDK